MQFVDANFVQQAVWTEHVRSWPGPDVDDGQLPTRGDPSIRSEKAQAN
jgi:hypothetical protein